jgi:mannose-1-phosphate guanylyltransferase
MIVIPTILAGGAGTRLWPLSRDDKPKQFHNLSGRGTLLEETIRRLMPLEPEHLVIVTSDRHERLSREEMGKFSIPGTVLAEPRPRNTAAAILYAALFLQKLYGDSIMISLPADHHIKDNAEFIRLLRLAVDQAGHGRLVTIGVRPTYPETGYGYIRAKEGAGPVIEIDSFVEKPDIRRAREYFESGKYFWNSGIFIWKSSSLLRRYELLLPDHVKAFQPLAGLSASGIASNNGTEWEIKKKIFDALDPVSIDYGIMEKEGDRVVIPGDFGWTDLGSWKSIDDILQPDGDRNRSPETGRAIFLNSKNCSVFAENRRVSVVGLSNIIVVEAGDEILVIDKGASQEVKKLAEMAKRTAR